ncbi:hypothetical protein D9615_008763 [Tricholomella constricta]|uniref:Uncharacterized protein n=1 Tax=Tricholomella constricta TaxID=117010 RepID=A0A8H5H7W0_9AGAR|nr:hypothetical protein D9615_008763 [Tricholomella constricta]
MVLSKRKRDGEFVPWTPAGQAVAASSTPALPQAKKARTKSSSNPSGASSSRAVQASASPSMKSGIATASHSLTKVEAQPKGAHASQLAKEIPQPGPSQPPKASRSRRETNPDEPEPEKRGAIFKKSCPKNILDRVERVMSQRFFMIDRQRTPGQLREVFSVLGSTGNVYTVTIDKNPSCNCPDAAKGNHCKHILFIFLKVLQVTQASGVWYQKALLTSELETVFAEAPLAPNSIAHPRIREAHARATGKADAETQSPPKKRIPGPDDDCPICYDGMHGVDEKSLVFCEDCGNALHKECFQGWKTSTLKDHKQLTCVWCRAQWASAGAEGASAGVGARRTREGYINLSGVSGISPIRDTSTYYHGPRRGQRHYGYQDYLD